MPVYLAKDFLAEYQSINLQFLTSTLLTIPSHLDSTDDYVQHFKSKIYTDLEKLNEEKLEELTKNEDDFQFQKGKTEKVSLESYDSPPLPISNPKNIIQIDSDSDFGISSSYDSFVMDANDLDSMNKLINRPHCAEEIKRLLPETDWFLEDINDACEFILPPIAVLHRKLKPVRVTDPFKEIRRTNKEAYRISPFIVNGDIENVKKGCLHIEFSKIEDMDFIECMYLDEIIFDPDSNPTSYLKNAIKTSIGAFSYFDIEEKNEENDLMKVLKMKEISSVLENLDSENEIKTKLIVDTDPVSPEPSVFTGILDSPETSFDSISTPNLPNIDAKKEELTDDTNNMHIISPKSKETLLKNIWNEEKIFGDMLLMLLPESSLVEHKLPQVSICFPNIDDKKICFDEEDGNDELEWDPLLNQYNLIAATEKSLLERVIPKRRHHNKRCRLAFEMIRVEDDVTGEFVLENWKLQEKKIQSLQYITSFKKIESNGIPLLKKTSNIPDGYHKPKLIDRKDNRGIVNKGTMPLCQITPIPHTKRGPGKEKESISPLDSYILLRKVKPPWNTLSDSDSSILTVPPVAQKVVSAAKVKPLNHDFETSGSNNGSREKCIKNDSKERKQLNSFPNDKHLTMKTADEIKNIVPSSSSKFNLKEKKNDQTVTNQENRLYKEKKERKSNSHQVMTHDIPVSAKDSMNEISTNDSLKLDTTDFSIERLPLTDHTENKVIPKMKKTVITLKLCDRYKPFFNELNDNLLSIVNFLRGQGCISQEFTLSSLTCERTLFLLKQEEKRFKEGFISHDVFSGVLCLHALTQVIDTVINCNILSACAILKSMTQKHESILGNCLEPLHKKLLSFFCGSEEGHVIHPKLKKLQYLITNWIKNDPTSRVIILIRRMFEFVAPNLLNFLSAIKNVNVNLYPPQDASESVYLDVFYKSNVILVHNPKDIQSCPWEYFQYAIEFEQFSDSLIDLASRGNPDLKQYISFKTFTFHCQLSDGNNPKIDCATATTSTILRTIPVLCTPSVAKEKELLLALESKLNIQLTVKDYSKLGFYVFPEFSFQPDIIIDERTGIVLVYAVDFIDTEEMFDIMQKKIISVALKCAQVYILLYKEATKNNNENLFGKLLTRIIPLVSTINSSLRHVTCKVLQTFSIKSLAKKIRYLCDKSLDSTESWNKELLGSTNWLREEFMESERFLLAYPFMNSFCAQSILRHFSSLKDLLKSSLDELIKELTTIPRFVLEALYHVHHSAHSPISIESDKQSVSRQYHGQYDDMADISGVSLLNDSSSCHSNERHAKSSRFDNVNLEGSTNISTAFSYPPNSLPLPSSASTNSNDKIIKSNARTPRKLPKKIDLPEGNHQHSPNATTRINDLGMRRDHFLRSENVESEDQRRDFPYTIPKTNFGDREVPSTSFDESKFSNLPTKNYPRDMYNEKFSDRNVPSTNVDQLQDIYYRDNNLSLYQQAESDLAPEYINSKNVPRATIAENFEQFHDMATSQDSVESFKLNLRKKEDGSISLFPGDSSQNENYEATETSHYTESLTSFTTNHSRLPADVDNIQYDSSMNDSRYLQQGSYAIKRPNGRPTNFDPRFQRKLSSKSTEVNSTTFPTLYNAQHKTNVTNFETVSRTNNISRSMNYNEVNDASLQGDMYTSNRQSIWDKNLSREIPRQAVKAFQRADNPNISRSYYDIPRSLPAQQSFSKNSCFTPGRFQNESTSFMSTNREGHYPNLNDSSWFSPERKKRKLTIKKVPGTKGGQTKLAFQ